MADPAISVLVTGISVSAGFMAFRTAREHGFNGWPKLALATIGVTLIWCAALFAARALMNSNGPFLTDLYRIVTAGLFGAIVGAAIGLIARRLRARSDHSGSS